MGKNARILTTLLTINAIAAPFRQLVDIMIYFFTYKVLQGMKKPVKDLLTKRDSFCTTFACASTRIFLLMVPGVLFEYASH